MPHIRARQVRYLGAPSTITRCLLLFAATAVGSCGTLTGPDDSPDFIFTGMIPRVGTSMTFHHFTVPRTGTLTASVGWETPQEHQTICVTRSDMADQSATCAAPLGGRGNTISVSVNAGDPYLIYGSPDFSADAAYRIEVRVR
jgi:hypothetical protein